MLSVIEFNMIAVLTGKLTRETCKKKNQMMLSKLSMMSKIQDLELWYKHLFLEPTLPLNTIQQNKK